MFLSLVFMNSFKHLLNFINSFSPLALINSNQLQKHFLYSQIYNFEKKLKEIVVILGL